MIAFPDSSEATVVWTRKKFRSLDTKIKTAFNSWSHFEIRNVHHSIDFKSKLLRKCLISVPYIRLHSDEAHMIALWMFEQDSLSKIFRISCKLKTFPFRQNLPVDVRSIVCSPEENPISTSKGSPSNFEIVSAVSCWSVVNSSKSRSLITKSKLSELFEVSLKRSDCKGILFE